VTNSTGNRECKGLALFEAYGSPLIIYCAFGDQKIVIEITETLL
jgi:hypothetical protein